jgi:hypothetical protein
MMRKGLKAQARREANKCTEFRSFTKGVNWDNQQAKWKVRRLDSSHFGMFNTLEEALAARKAVEAAETC